MTSLYKYVALIMSLGLLVGCGTTFGTTQQTMDIETPLVTEVGLPERPETLLDIQSLLRNDGETCQLPCFWGFRPSYTTEQDVLEFLQPEAIGNNPPELIYRFPLEQERIFSLSFGEQDGLITLISVFISNPSEWLPTETLELSHLLETMPHNSEIYLSINITTQKAFLTLAYDEGVLAQYAFNLNSEGSSTLEADFSFCTELSSNSSIQLKLRDADAQTMLERFGMLDESVQDSVWTIDRMTGMSAEEFVTQVIDNPDGCIDIYSYAELSEMGYGGF
jgi:hypothetical protein